MKMTAKIIALVSLLVLIYPSMAFLGGSMGLDKAKGIMLAATVVWFICATLWMWEDKVEQSELEDEQTVI